MNIIKTIILLLVSLFIVYPVYAFPIPKDHKASFDIIRKNKVIGNVNTSFAKQDDKLLIHTIVNIHVKIFLLPDYKFFQETTETWLGDEFIKINGFTDFEDEREYNITGEDINGKFLASGMDGELELDESILTLNYWNKNILNQKEVFDTQKGIVREIYVNKLDNEIIEINGNKLEVEKFKLNASKNPKDKGPFPEYTLWYYGEELIKFEFKNWKDKKIVTTIRNDWNK